MMINSSTSLIEFIETMHFPAIYVEDNFPLAVKGNFRTNPNAALDYLLANAEVGSKSVGFFHIVPAFTPVKPLRSACVLFSTALPIELKIPVFFCKGPEQLETIVPKAIKTSLDTALPVQIVLAANALNNYTERSMAGKTLDRAQPYINRQVIDTAWEPSAKLDKLRAAYEAMPAAAKVKDEISFYRTEAYFPEYIFPIEAQAQAKAFKGMDVIQTSKQDLAFLHLWLNEFLGLNMRIEATIAAPENPTKTLLCPGCPFPAIFSHKDATSTIMFTGIKCPAVFDLFPLSAATVAEYAGMLSQKPNVATAFIGNASEIAAFEGLLNGTIIALQDVEGKSSYPQVAINKFKKFANCNLPYSCNNIKRLKQAAVKEKKCSCIKLGTEPVCISCSHCPALRPTLEATVSINNTSCTGCRICANVCPTGAIA